MAGSNHETEIEIVRLLKIIGAKEVELDIYREKIVALTAALDSADAELTKVRAQLEKLEKKTRKKATSKKVGKDE